ncbi:MAG: prepilin-type N-terminal cleavage/methylation domain-containing protein [Pirellulaceae bacterium]
MKAARLPVASIGSVSARSGFTLLEMIVVVLLLAVLSGVGFLSVRSTLAQATRQQVISQIVALDAQERAASRSNPAGGGLQHVSEHELRCRLSDRSVRVSGDLSVSRLLQLTAGAAFQEVAEIPFVLSGNSPTYAVELTDANAVRSWVVVLGISGQAFPVENEAELLAMVSASRVSL